MEIGPPGGAAVNFFQFHLGDYARDTAHLTLLEDAVYMRLLRRYYAEEAPLEDDLQQLYRWAGARSEEERAAVETVLREFFTLVSGYWHNGRADREIEAYQDKQAKASASARKRWENAGNTDAMRTHSKGNANHKPRTNNQEPEKNGGAKRPKRPREKFVAPTLEEVEGYIREKGYQVDPVRFMAHYEANGWRVGKNPMKDWRAAVVGWHTRDQEQGRGGAPPGAAPATRRTSLRDDLEDTSWAR